NKCKHLAHPWPSCSIAAHPKQSPIDWHHSHLRIVGPWSSVKTADAHLRPQNRTLTSGRLERCTESIKRTWRVLRVITKDWVRMPSPEKRTPFRREPSVTPVAAKMISLPG